MRLRKAYNECIFNELKLVFTYPRRPRKVDEVNSNKLGEQGSVSVINNPNPEV